MILTLCGSARFESAWHEANKQLGLAGHICFSLMTFPSIEGGKSWYTPEQKWALDLAHLAKIEESAGVVMLNIDHYLGESSLRELQWARLRGKRVYWTLRPLERPNDAPDAGLFNGVADRCARSLLRDSYSGNWHELLAAIGKQL